MMNGIRVSLVISLLPLLHYRANVASHRVPGEQFGGWASSEGVGNVLQPWVRRGPGTFEVCVYKKRQSCWKLRLFCASRCCPHLIGWQSFLSPHFQNVTLQSVSLIFTTLRVSLSNMSILPSPPHCPSTWPSRQTEANFQRRRDGAKRPLSGWGWKSGGYSLRRPSAWLAVQPWASHLASLDVTKSIFGKGRF